jgi:Domain of unknown function (DUF4351)
MTWYHSVKFPARDSQPPVRLRTPDLAVQSIALNPHKTMRRDPIFYQMFQRSPQLLFDLREAKEEEREEEREEALQRDRSLILRLLSKKLGNLTPAMGDRVSTLSFAQIEFCGINSSGISLTIGFRPSPLPRSNPWGKPCSISPACRI